MNDLDKLKEILGPHDPTKRYMCAVCLTQYATRDEKDACMKDRHGYTILDLGRKK